MSDEQLVMTSDKKKKISFFSAILIVIGGSVGAGIFLRSDKVLRESGGNIFWSIFAWTLAAFAVVTMAIALVEVASGRNDNLGMIGWNKAFNGVYVYKGCKWFMTFLYLPFTFYFMPLYVIIQMQDAASGFVAGGGELINKAFGENDWIIMMILSLGISAWFFFTAGLSSWLGNIQNWIVTSLKFIPLIVVTVIGLVFAGGALSKPVAENSTTTVGQSLMQITWWDAKASSLKGLSPIFGLFTSMAGIFFAYDGFYVTAGIQSEMAEPKKTPLALVLGLSSVTAIYLILAISMTIGATEGGFYGFADPLANIKSGWLFGIINMFISIGILGIINGFVMWCTRFVEDLVKEGELWVPHRIYKKMLVAKTPLVGTIYSIIISIPVVFAFNVVGSLAYFPDDYDGLGYGGKHFSSNLGFADLMANWLAVIAFAFIALSIFGALKNRKGRWIEVEEGKHTVWAGWTAVTLVFSALFVYGLNSYVALGLLSSNGGMYVEGTKTLSNEFIGQLVTSILLPVFALFMFGMVPIEKFIVNKKKALYERKLSENLSEEDRKLYLELQEFNNLRISTFEVAR
ncbi:APC family permease [Mycoplasma zalophi]|uniref:APC family permease n=1 Tax=Mycoplasma zalophi TaxID=191287 RepID=UPI0021C7B931|nr:APC family permease [Mycoplasma zalophi]MCU4117330.1 APC family permease [Mycoplasma zalophi]